MRNPARWATLVIFATFALAQYGSDTKERDRWQRPSEVMDALGIRPGSVVADIGAGRGYFTFRIAERVGPTGKLYSEDIADEVIEDITRRARERKLSQIEVVRGTENDVRLPADSMDVVMIVDTYHEFRDHDAIMRSVHRALKPGGKLGIIDKVEDYGLRRSAYHDKHAINEELVKDEVVANGFRFARKQPGFTSNYGQHWWFLIFEKPAE
jgi:predicted methyltransferase